MCLYLHYKWFLTRVGTYTQGLIFSWDIKIYDVRKSKYLKWACDIGTILFLCSTNVTSLFAKLGLLQTKRQNLKQLNKKGEFPET